MHYGHRASFSAATATPTAHKTIFCLPFSDRDSAITELATAYADMDAMQATLSDSAVYVRYLRKKASDLPRTYATSEEDKVKKLSRDSIPTPDC